MTEAAPDKRAGGILWVAIVVLALLAAGLSALVSYRAITQRGERGAEPQHALHLSIELPDFELINLDSERWGKSEMANSIWVVNFVFTRCPGPCLAMSQAMARLQKELPEEVKLLTVTVDPEHDTPEVLRTYSGSLGAEAGRWVFLTGSQTEVYELIQKGFKLPVEELEEPTEDGPIAHSTRFVLVDRQTRIRGYYEGLVEEGRVELHKAAQILLKEER